MVLSATSYFWPFFKHAVDVSEAHASCKLSKDLPEELLGIYSGAPSPVVLLLASTGTVRVKARRTVRVILLPFQLVTQHLHTEAREQINIRLNVLLE